MYKHYVQKQQIKDGKKTEPFISKALSQKNFPEHNSAEQKNRRSHIKGKDSAN